MCVVFADDISVVVRAPRRSERVRQLAVSVEAELVQEGGEHNSNAATTEGGGSANKEHPDVAEAAPAEREFVRFCSFKIA